MRWREEPELRMLALLVYAMLMVLAFGLGLLLPAFATIVLYCCLLAGFVALVLVP